MESEEQPDAAHAPGTAEGAALRADRRWALRRGIELAADVTDSSGFGFPARIVEISEEGCRLCTYDAPVLDRHLLHEIKVTGLEPLGAYVVWASGEDVGLTFATPLDPVTVRSLVTKSLYARLSRRLSRAGRGTDELGNLPPFPFPD